MMRPRILDLSAVLGAVAGLVIVGAAAVSLSHDRPAPTAFGPTAASSQAIRTPPSTVTMLSGGSICKRGTGLHSMAVNRTRYVPVDAHTQQT